MQLIGGSLPFFDPYGWTPQAGFDDALAVLGWACTTHGGGSETDALARLKAALDDGPVWVGPVEMGHLRHQPGRTGAIGADHYVVVLEIADGRVVMHDPEGHPYATLPLPDFMAAWRAETVDYATPYTMRTAFRQVAEVSADDAVAAALPAAIRWLSMAGDYDMPPGSLGNGDAAEALATRIESDCDANLRDHLIQFAVRVGARRAADAAACLARVGHTRAAEVAARQARLIGGLQHPLVMHDDATVAAGLRRLAPTYDELLAALT